MTKRSRFHPARLCFLKVRWQRCWTWWPTWLTGNTALLADGGSIPPTSRAGTSFTSSRFLLVVKRRWLGSAQFWSGIKVVLCSLAVTTKDGLETRPRGCRCTSGGVGMDRLWSASPTWQIVLRGVPFPKSCSWVLTLPSISTYPHTNSLVRVDRNVEVLNSFHCLKTTRDAVCLIWFRCLSVSTLHVWGILLSFIKVHVWCVERCDHWGLSSNI